MSGASSSKTGSRGLDPVSFRDEALARLRERIVAYAASRMQRDLAEDLAQEVLLVLQERYAAVEAMEDLLPLGFRILRFKLAASVRKSVRRGEQRQIPVEDLPLADPNPDPEAETRRREDTKRLTSALRKLEGRCRRIFLLKLEGRSFAEIRDILGAVSVNTVYTWDSRCRQRLLKLLGGRWEAER
jgi:RNA polymerase sigma-70 factor (ECF subfamily)